MFVVYECSVWEPADNHKYFRERKNAEDYANKLILEGMDTDEVQLVEIQTED